MGSMARSMACTKQDLTLILQPRVFGSEGMSLYRLVNRREVRVGEVKANGYGV